MRNHTLSCCCTACIGDDSRRCERCEDGTATDGGDYCRACLDAMYPSNDAQDRSDDEALCSEREAEV